jgi:hypothetical protein
MDKNHGLDSTPATHFAGALKVEVLLQQAVQGPVLARRLRATHGESPSAGNTCQLWVRRATYFATQLPVLGRDALGLKLADTLSNLAQARRMP